MNDSEKVLLLTGRVSGVAGGGDAESRSDLVGCVENEGSGSVGGGEVTSSSQEG